MLRVAVIGYNAPCSIRAMYEVARACEDDRPIFNVRDRRVVMESGTVFEAIIGDCRDWHRYKGFKYDQLIIVDDQRFQVLISRSGILEQLFEALNDRSCVPEEFRVQFYEW